MCTNQLDRIQHYTCTLIIHTCIHKYCIPLTGYCSVFRVHLENHSLRRFDSARGCSEWQWFCTMRFHDNCHWRFVIYNVIELFSEFGSFSLTDIYFFLLHYWYWLRVHRISLLHQPVQQQTSVHQVTIHCPLV